jgi:hypothetical protein
MRVECAGLESSTLFVGDRLYSILILQREFILQRDFGYYNETLRLGCFEPV